MKDDGLNAIRGMLNGLGIELIVIVVIVLITKITELEADCMSKVTNPLEVIDYCPVCEAELLFGQLVLKHGVELLCSTTCFIKRIGAVVITAGDHERSDAAKHENDPTG